MHIGRPAVHPAVYRSVMLRIESHGDVTRLHLASLASRSIGYEVSAYVTRGVLVDTGFPRVGRAVAAWARTHRPAGALVTHYHEDHAGNVDRLSALGFPVGLPDGTAARLLAPTPIGWYRRYCWGSARALPAAPAPFAHPALALVPARGHTPDHHVVWDAERETVFGGDLFIGVKVRMAHPGEDIRAQVEALRRVAALTPRRYFDAHRGPVRDPVAQLTAKADWMEEMIAAIDRRAREGWSAEAIRDAVLGREDLTGRVSRGDYARINFVRSVLRSTPATPGQ
jgi:endoribonuclease LACTB2